MMSPLQEKHLITILDNFYKKINMKNFALKSLLILFIFKANFFTAQDQEILLTINGNPVYKSEFEQIYWKNKKESIATKDDLNEYIELFKKFKLKVAAAEELGLDTIQKFISELQGYRVQLEKPYLIDTSSNESLIKEAYYRTVNEISASHILVKVDPNASAEDTLTAYKKISSIRKNILSGKYSFKEAASKFSEDPSAKRNGGYLGFFGAFRMVYEFENACYNTKIGGISEPFRSQFGYHIVEVDKTRKGRGKVKVAHIMVSTKAEDSEQKKQNNEKKIKELYQKLLNGESFKDLAVEFSDDRNSARKGGELDWIQSSGSYYKEFESAVFSLENDNDISEPFLTPAGWHIVKRLDYVPLGDFKSLKNELKVKIQKNIRSDISKKTFISKLKKEYSFNENRQNLNEIYKLVNNKGFSTKLVAENKKKLSKVLFSFDDSVYTQFDFADHLSTSKSRNRGELKDYVNTAYNSYVNAKLMDFEKSKLESKHPDFKALLKEYRDGILLFEISDQMIWTKAIKDTSGLKDFYSKNKSTWMWEDRLKLEIFSSTNEKTIKKAYVLKKKGKLKNDSILNYLNKDSQLTVKFEEGKKNKSDLAFLIDVVLSPGLNKPFKFDNKFFVVNQLEEIPSAPKEIFEAEGAITAAYQEYLEQQWLSDLAKKYPIEVNYDVLYSIVNKPN